MCALEQDLEVLPGGDETEIGEKVLACVSMCNCGSDYFLMTALATCQFHPCM